MAKRQEVVPSICRVFKTVLPIGQIRLQKGVVMKLSLRFYSKGMTHLPKNVRYRYLNGVLKNCMYYRARQCFFPKNIPELERNLSVT